MTDEELKKARQDAVKGLIVIVLRLILIVVAFKVSQPLGVCLFVMFSMLMGVVWSIMSPGKDND